MMVQADVLEGSQYGLQVRIARVFARIPACGRRRRHARGLWLPEFFPVVRYQCLKYSTRRIVGGISAVRSIRRPNRNARIVSFIADPGNIVASYTATLMRIDGKNR